MWPLTKHPTLKETRGLVKELHAGQYYGEHKYTVHLDRVARRVSIFLDDPKMMHAALLHDTIEDCRNFDERSLRRLGYNRKIIQSVQDLTKTQRLRRPALPKTWQGENALLQIAWHHQVKSADYKLYMEKLLQPSVDPDTHRIKYADMCENLENSRKNIERLQSHLEGVDPAEIQGRLNYWKGRVSIYQNAMEVLSRESPVRGLEEHQNPQLEV